MDRPRSLLRDAVAVFVLWILVIVFTWRIALGGRVLAGGDIFTYFYPYWAEATRAIRAARLPLWNSSLFMGAPFLANSQVGFFYPPNWLLWLLFPAHRSVHLTVLIHLCLAAFNAYLWGRRSLGLERVAASLVAVIFALGGYLGAQIEHVNQLQGLAWLPLLLMLYDQMSDHEASTVTRRTAFVGLATLVGLVLLAGHTQTAFISLVGLAVYGLGPSLLDGLRRGDWHLLARVVVLLGVAVAIGVALAAAQLVPTGELSRHSVRARGLPFGERVSFSLSPIYAPQAFLPGFARPVRPDRIEYVTYVGITGLALAIMELVTLVRSRCGLRDDRLEAGRAGPLAIILLTLLGLFFAFGLYNPLYLLLARYVPGFAHFRVPARWLVLYYLGAAGLAGLGVQGLLSRERRIDQRTVLIIAGSLVGLVVWAVMGSFFGGGDHLSVLDAVGWAGAILVTTALFLFGAGRPRVMAAGLLVMLIIELFLASTTLPHARATAPQAFTSIRPATAHLLASQSQDSEPFGRFLSMSDTTFDPGDLALIESIYHPQLSSDQFYEYVIAAKQKEIASPNLPLAFQVPSVDGYDGGVLPLERYVLLQRLFLREEQVSIDGRLRENLPMIPQGRWLKLFNVRYVITDKLRDAWIHDVFYDLQFGARLSKGEQVLIAHVPPFEATALGLVSRLKTETQLPDGVRVAVVTLTFEDKPIRTFELRVGEEVTTGADQQERVEPSVARLRWGQPARPLTITVRTVLPDGEWMVDGASLIDERTGSFQSLVLSDRGEFRLVHSGDVKIYENLDLLPRAFVVHDVQMASDDQAALTAMRDSGFDPGEEAVLQRVASSCPSLDSGLPAGTDDGIDRSDSSPGRAAISQYRPERVVVETELDDPGYLVLTDAWYPGWKATVDGTPATICRADLLFRAVALEPGTHQVVFSFRPRTSRTGIAISILALVALSTILGFSLRSSVGEATRQGARS